MKKYILLVLLILIFPSLYAQQNNIHKWKERADNEYKVFKEEIDKQSLGEQPDEERMYNSLLNLYNFYVQTNNLAQTYEDNNMGVNPYITYIADILKEVRPYFINAGTYYNEKNDYSKASFIFELYSEYPTLRIFNDERVLPLELEEHESIIKYYAAICAIQANENSRTIDLIKKLVAEPYIANDTYEENTLYELLAYAYQEVNDIANFKETLRIGADKFPTNKYFLPNLINEYIKDENYDESLKKLDSFISANPDQNCELISIKGSILIQMKNPFEAEAVYLQALKKDKDCGKALDGLGVLYILQAQDLKGLADYQQNRKTEIEKEAVYYYEKSLPYLERYYALLKKEDANEFDIKSALQKLQNVYYNLQILGINKEKEFNKVDALLNEL